MTKLLITSDTHKGFSHNTTLIHDKWAERFQQQEWDVVILAGDIASHRKQHFKAALKWWRKQAGDKPILLARGNHDLWDRSTRNLEGLRNHLHHEWFAESNIHHLESAGPFWIDNTCVVGFDGWYHRHPQTNDPNHMRGRTLAGNSWRWLQSCAMHGFDAALKAAEQAKTNRNKVVTVTHFPIVEEVPASPRHRYADPGAYDGNPYYGERLREFTDLLIYGHSHHAVDIVVENTRVVNCGSDYNRPKHLIIEV